MAIHVGDSPTVKLTVTEDGANVDMSGASTLNLRFRKPDRTVLNKTATYEAPNIAKVTLSTAETDLPGPWEVQAYITGLSGWTGFTEKVEFTVKDVIPAA